MSTLRWSLAPDSPSEAELFPQGIRVRGKGEYRGLEFLEVDARTIINRVPGPPRFGFSHSINMYRGCSHRCVFCFARPTHAYLDLNIADDFDRKIVVKRNAVELTRAETAPQQWGGDLIAMGTNTDPYQPAEGKYKLTRGILEVMVQRANPVSILTKSPLVLRDIELLADLTARTEVRVDFSVGTVDEAVWAATEPGAPHPRRRLEAVARLNAAGVSSGVLMGPILPGLSDGEDQLRAAVAAAIEAGAVGIGHVALHLGPGIREHFMTWLEAAHPHLVPWYQDLYGGPGKMASPEYRKSLAKLIGRISRELGGPEPLRPQAAVARRTKPAGRRATQLALKLGI